jgi:AraC-like DNA-binding protein
MASILSDQATLDANAAKMIELFGTLAPHEGTTCSALDGVRFSRTNTSVRRRPALYEPQIVIVCQGRKRGYLGDHVYVYDRQQYLVLSVPLPLESEIEASAEEPLLAISIRVELSIVAELVMALTDRESRVHDEPRGIYSTPLDRPMSDAVLRLLEALASPIESRILAPSIIRELHYRILVGPQGHAIRAALTHQHHFGRIARALRRIHADYRAALDVDTLAREAGMSAAVFHAQFKAVTSTSPMQYVKTTRLHQARLLMVQDGMNASVAATRVGYESPSQFSREFKRLFGLSPSEEVRRVRNGAEAAPRPAVVGLPSYVSTP